MIILTSNQSLGAWGEVLGDPVIASALLDRLLHHSSTMNIKGESYRLHEKLKAGGGQIKNRGRSGFGRTIGFVNGARTDDRRVVRSLGHPAAGPVSRGGGNFR